MKAYRYTGYSIEEIVEEKDELGTIDQLRARLLDNVVKLGETNLLGAAAMFALAKDAGNCHACLKGAF